MNHQFILQLVLLVSFLMGSFSPHLLANSNFDHQMKGVRVSNTSDENSEGMLLPPTSGMHSASLPAGSIKSPEPVKILLPKADAQIVTHSAERANKETVSIGGLLSKKEAAPKTQSPYFGEVPIMGNLFRTKSSPSDKSDFTVFVTPKLADPTDNN